MLKKCRIYILLLFLAAPGILCAEDTIQANQPIAEETIVLPSERSLTDSLNEQKTRVLKNKIEEYIASQSTHIPHRSFWEKSTRFFYQFLVDLNVRVLPDRWHPFIHSVIDIIFNVPLLVILLLLSCTLIANVIMVSVILLLVTYYKRTREGYLEKLNKRYEGILTNYLFYETSMPDTLKELKKNKSSLGRTLLIDIFFNYQRNLSGEYRDRILDLYKEMKLYKVSQKRMRSIHTYKRVKGIRELANMYPSGAKSLILRYVKDRNRMVRSEAQIAFTYLDEDTSFSFLDDLDRHLSTWVQLNMLNYVKLHERDVPSFRKWINSPNNDVQDFSIRMMNYFQQSENSADLIRMLNHPNPQTRYYVYQTIRHLSLFEGKEPAKSQFESEIANNRFEILRIVCDLGTESDFDFLIGILKADDVRMKILACKAFFRMGEAGKAFLKEYSESEDFDLKRYIEHIKDPRN